MNRAAAKLISRQSLTSEVERLKRLVVETMDVLAEQVLDQIQTTRGMAEQTETLLEQLQPSESRAVEADDAERHLRQVIGQLEEVLRDLPEASWDDFAQTCVQLGRTLKRLPGIDET